MEQPDSRPTVNARIAWVALTIVVLVPGLVRFVGAGLVPALRELTGDFGATFPTAYFATLRPDFPTDKVWPGWYYGPVQHFLTLPLFLAPSWSMVPKMWAVVNAVALLAAFWFTRRLAGAGGATWWGPLGVLAGLWLFYQPLVNCFAQGNIEIVEMTLVLGALVALTGARRHVSGLLLGVATMVKFLPAGFLLWMLVRRQWRLVSTACLTILVIAGAAAVTLDWRNSSSFKVMTWAADTPFAGMHELSITSLFLHRSSVLDEKALVPLWIPSERARVAVRAGSIASLLLVAGLGLALFLRRRKPISPGDIGVLFLTMFMILPWNHDYYYLFAVVPFSFLFLEGIARRRTILLAAALVGFVLISPPVPFSVVDKLGLSSMPFAYLVNYFDLPVVGAVLWWWAATYQMVTDGTETTRTPARRGTVARRRIGWTLGLVAAGLGALGILAAARDRRPAAVRHELRTETLPAFSPPAVPTGIQTFTLSPDGTRLAYVGEHEGRQRVCVRLMSPGTGSCFAGTDGASEPFFSPDGTKVAFFANRRLITVSLTNGAVEDVCAAEGGRTGRWDSSGALVYSIPAGIARVAGPGGVPRMLVQLNPATEGALLWPELLPRGDVVLFTVLPPGGTAVDGAIFAQSMRNGRRSLVATGGQSHYDVRTNHLVYARAGRVLAAPFDQRRLVVAGLSMPLVDDVRLSAEAGAQFAVSPDGLLVFASGPPAAAYNRVLVRVDRQGQVSRLGMPPGGFDTPRVSPDGHSLAVTVRDATSDVWVYDLVNGSGRRLVATDAWITDPETGTRWRTAAGPSQNQLPVWQPGDAGLTLSASGGYLPTPALLQVPLEDEGNATLLRQGMTGFRPTSWSPRGLALAGTRHTDGAARQIWVLEPLCPAESTRLARMRQLWPSRFNQRDPVFSPLGRWLAYTSDETGRNEVYVQALPAAELTRPCRFPPYAPATPGGRLLADLVHPLDAGALFVVPNRDLVEAARGEPLGERGLATRWQVSTSGGEEPVWGPDGRELFYRRGDALMTVRIEPGTSFTASDPRVLFSGRFDPGVAEANYDVTPDGRYFIMLVRDPSPMTTTLRAARSWTAKLGIPDVAQDR